MGIGIDGAEQEDLGGSSGRLPADQPGRKDPGVVQDKGVARIQVLVEVPEAAILESRLALSFVAP